MQIHAWACMSQCVLREIKNLIRQKMRALFFWKPCLHQALTARACLHSRSTCPSVSVSIPAAHPRCLVTSFTDRGRSISSASAAHHPPALRSLRARLSAENLHGIRSMSSSRSMLDLCDQDKCLVNLFLAASSHQWQLLPGKLSDLAGAPYQMSSRSCYSGNNWTAELARACYGHGCSVVHVRDC